MKEIVRATMLLALIAFLLGSCGNDSGSDGDGDSGDSGTGADVPATNLDCAGNWDSAGGDYSAGALDQTVTFTFSLPEDYVGEYPYMIGAAFAPNDDLPTTTIPVLVGQSIFDPGPLTAGSSFTFTNEQFNRLPMINENSCGKYYFVGANIYFGEMSFPTNMEWLGYSDVKYQIGGDAIVVDVGDLAFAR